MIVRIVALAWVALKQAAVARPGAWIAALGVFVAPCLLLLTTGDDLERAWMLRGTLAEGLRLGLPVAVIAAGAYLLRPGAGQGWASLPARRAEWFVAVGVAGGLLTLVTAALLALGVVFAGAVFGLATRLDRTTGAVEFYLEKGTGNDRQVARPDGTGFVLVPPGRGGALVFEFEHDPAREVVEGAMEFEVALTGRSAPSPDSPVRVVIEGESGDVDARTTVHARRRISFSAPNPGGNRLRVLCTAIDPSLAVGARPDAVRLTVEHAPAWPRVLWLAILGCAASLLPGAVVLAVRALSTAPTAALAGLLLLATLTLLPALSPGSEMARDRRAATGEQADEDWTQSAGRTLSSLPALYPQQPFDSYLKGKIDAGADMSTALVRLALGVLIVGAGAVLFTRRQMKN